METWTDNSSGSLAIIQYKWPLGSSYFTDEQVMSCVRFGWSYSVDTTGWSHLTAPVCGLSHLAPSPVRTRGVRNNGGHIRTAGER